MTAEITDREGIESTLKDRVCEADPDADHIAFWAAVSCWTPDEATMLSLGLEPPTLAAPLTTDPTRPSTIEYRQRELLILRAIAAGQLPFPLTPSAFIEWAERHEIPIPNSLRQAVIDVERKHGKATTGDNLHAKVVASLQKMVLGMAVGGYGHDPTDHRSKTVSEIVEDLRKLGIPLSDGTVRSRLKEAHEKHGQTSTGDISR